MIGAEGDVENRDVAGPGEEAQQPLSELRARLAAGEGETSKEEEEPIPKEELGPEATSQREELAQEDEERVPAYLRDEPPEGKVNWTKWALMHGMTEDEVEDRGINHQTVRICAQELEKDGYRKRPKKGGALQPAPSRGVQIFAKGSPPEALIEGIHLPLDGEQAKSFEKGLKTGATLIVLGVRIAQELSSVGIQQAKPIMDMAREMRSGEAAAARDAASEAAGEAAERVAQVFGPALANLQRPPEGADPMKSMVARVMEPMIHQMMRMFMPGAAPTNQPPGWPVVKE